MCGAQQPRPERHGGRPPDLELALVDRWAQLAMKQPWRYTATWGVGVGATNLGLRMLLNDLSLIHNARHAICTAIGLSVFAWLYTAQLTRPLRRRRRPHSATDTAVTKQSYAAHWRSSRRSLAHGQHPSGHVQDVGSHQSGQVSGQEFNPGPGYGDGA